MKRRLAVTLTLAVFLTAQAAAVAHAAGFGPGKHTHHGKACGVCLFSEQAKSSAPPGPPVPLASGRGSVTFSVSVFAAPAGGTCSSALPRAPPVTLL